MVSVPLRNPPASTTVQVPTTLTVSAVAMAKPQTVSPSSPANNPASSAVLQGVTSQSIKQVNQLFFFFNWKFLISEQLELHNYLQQAVSLLMHN